MGARGGVVQVVGRHDLVLDALVVVLDAVVGVVALKDEQVLH